MKTFSIEEVSFIWGVFAGSEEVGIGEFEVVGGGGGGDMVLFERDWMADSKEPV